ncbi:hypothetical protein [Shewanella khirikhana]|uniref:DUF4231 domain-containing protein n=1 Tax=Shewanella khirikhana TaxID=1965282 RepID=A0ABM7D0A0_9GAMM|nr:hypothetical protein [Shewanella khirikhana]AZQ09801.1 hypothetical protein STH12_00662 [Shewanella khirikhana]
MPQSDYSQEEYQADFLDNKCVTRQALDRALDTRKFEIELYWKRATYFWTFIGATLAGFIAVQASSIENKTDLSVVLSCVGFVFSFAWFCVNRGSKHWQENWEKHVDMLEDKVSGPLYKVVLTRGKPTGKREHLRHWMTGPSPLSVSKINQLISLYVSLLWGILVCYSLPEFNRNADMNWFYVGVIFLSILACISFLWLARSYQGGFWHNATIRTTKINNGYQ